MQWRLIQEELGLNQAAAARIMAVLNGLQQRFFELCCEHTHGKEPVVEQLHAFISAGNPDPETISAFLTRLLQQEEINGRNKFDLMLEMERGAKEQILLELTGQQAAQFQLMAPESLLDIEAGHNPLSAWLERKALENAPAGFVCRSPYEYMHVQANGDVYPCCPSKFGKVIGNLATQNITEIWNSQAAREVRASIENGEYTYCNAAACEYLRKANVEQTELSPKALVEWLNNKNLLNHGRTPKVINLGSDRTCNLECGYCRKELYKLTETEKERITLIDKNTFSTLSDDTERIVLLGEGDPFASPVYLNKLRTYNWAQHNKLRIKIQTNGLLLTPAVWDSIANSHCVIDWISVSVDAATPETYKTNRGGDFHKLVQNLEFIAQLRAQNKIRKFWINFLVQKNNYREIPDFALLGKRLGCDLVEFQRLENWGTYNETEYRERAVHEHWHENHADLKRVLQHPVLQNREVWMLKLSEAAGLTEVGIVSWDE